MKPIIALFAGLLTGCVTGARPACIDDVDCAEGRCVEGACLYEDAPQGDAEGVIDAASEAPLSCPAISVEVECVEPYDERYCVYEFMPAYFGDEDCDDICEALEMTCHVMLDRDATHECRGDDIPAAPVEDHCVWTMGGGGWDEGLGAQRCVCLAR